MFSSVKGDGDSEKLEREAALHGNDSSGTVRSTLKSDVLQVSQSICSLRIVMETKCPPYQSPEGWPKLILSASAPGRLSYMFEIHPIIC